MLFTPTESDSHECTRSPERVPTEHVVVHQAATERPRVTVCLARVVVDHQTATERTKVTVCLERVEVAFQLSHLIAQNNFPKF